MEAVPGKSKRSYAIVKRVLDTVLAGIFLVLLSPFLAVLALLFAASSSRPILFTQKRAGMNGKPFTIYKFRTMVVNAEKLGKEGRKSEELITRIGGIIRPLHLDELPQLWNILKGEMSLVGCRPLIIEAYKNRLMQDPSLKEIHSIKPGLTGLFSVLCLIDKKAKDAIIERYHLLSFGGTRQYNFGHRVELFYVANMDLLLDLKIIYWTFILELEWFGKLLLKSL